MRDSCFSIQTNSCVVALIQNKGGDGGRDVQGKREGMGITPWDGKRTLGTDTGGRELGYKGTELGHEGRDWDMRDWIGT